MAIVLPCPMTVHAYAAAGRELEFPRPDCPSCSQAMSFWGFYSRPVRVGEEIRVLVRRARCARCATSHALLPDFVLLGRLDGLEVVGSALEQIAAGAGTRQVAGHTGVPHTTVRGWRRRFAARAGMLTAGFLAATVALGDLVPRLVAGAMAGAGIRTVSGHDEEQGSSGGLRVRRPEVLSLDPRASSSSGTEEDLHGSAVGGVGLLGARRV